ncbi:MAG TPA: class I SAM-dependent methyltransferase [Acetobacteraceae bacterium]|nr:class I SAM-dependent methyltransferase [Acetobacteraceae bacterium]
MDGMLTLMSKASSAPGDLWVEVFRQRGVWQLSRDIVDRWVARNAVFFGMLSRLVPHGGKILELGCGPGRHALGAATLGYQVLGLDLDPLIVRQAQANADAVAPDCGAVFRTGDMFDLAAVAPPATFQAITHGGVMEHLDSAETIRKALRAQLAVAPTVVFDIPFDSPKNRVLFDRDDIFRQLWTAEEWVDDVLAGLAIVEARTDLHPESNMTDDLVVALRA